MEDSHFLFSLLAHRLVGFAGLKLPLTLAWMIFLISMFIFPPSEQLSCYPAGMRNGVSVMHITFGKGSVHLYEDFISKKTTNTE